MATIFGLLVVGPGWLEDELAAALRRVGGGPTTVTANGAFAGGHSLSCVAPPEYFAGTTFGTTSR